MSGFLTNLLARSRGTAEVVKPRVSSLFEPPGLNTTAAEWEGAMEDVEEAAEPLDAAAPSIRAREPHIATAAAAPAHDAATSPSNTPARVDEVRSQLSERDSLQPPRHVARPPAAPVAPTPPHRVIERSTPPVQHSEAPPRVAGATPALPQEARGLAPNPVRPTSEAPAPDLNRARSDGVPTERTILKTVDRPVLAPPSRPRFQPVPAVQKSVAAEPVVHVTIGRIEVRAISEPEPRRKERAASPVMSLNDYLKTRAGGGTR